MARGANKLRGHYCDFRLVGMVVRGVVNRSVK